MKTKIFLKNYGINREAMTYITIEYGSNKMQFTSMQPLSAIIIKQTEYKQQFKLVYHNLLVKV